MRIFALLRAGLPAVALATTLVVPAMADHDGHGRGHDRGNGRGPEKDARTVVVQRPRRTVVVRTAPRRTRVVVHRGHPIRRPLPLCVVRSPRRPVLVMGAVFLAPRIFTIGFVTRPPRTAVVWEDSETLQREDDWTEFSLNVEDRGQRLVLELVGKAQIDFADVVFANGEVQTVDFRSKTCQFGVYELLNFEHGRRVDHVRFVARAKTPETRFIVRMQG